MRYILTISMIFSFLFVSEMAESNENRYQKIEFSNENNFFETLSEALSTDLSTKEIQKVIKVFKVKQEVKNFKDTKSLIDAQPTSAKTLISNVRRLNLETKILELNLLKSHIFDVAKINAVQSTTSKIPIAAVVTLPALAVLSGLGSSLPTLSINDVTTSDEAAGDATFTVTLSEVSDDTVTVSYKTSNGTATSGADYTAVSVTTLTFSSGETSKSLTVGVLADSLDEANETVALTLSSASNATILDATGTLTIVDDDAMPLLSINDVTKAEVVGSSTTASFTVTLSAASGQTVSVSYATSNGTARAGADYTAVFATMLSFSAGDTTKTFNVTVLADTSYEISETATITLSSASNAIVSDATGTLTITDNFLNSGTQLTEDISISAAARNNSEFNRIMGTGSSTQNPLVVGNFDRAWGYGLTGSGIQVAVMDSRYNNSHSDLNAKTIFTYGNLLAANSSYMHGLAVTGIISADYGDGGLVGAVPNVSLHLTDYNGYSSGNWVEHLTAGTNDASSAKVQNNSWGWNASLIDDEIALMSSNGWTKYQVLANRMLGSTSSAAIEDVTNYVTALNNFQNHGVIVFSNSNTSSNDNAEITAALPELFLELSEAFIAAVNVEIVGNPGSETYTLMSAPCGDAGPYCLAGDGYQIATLYYDDDYYHTNGSGTSYVAPQISAAVAVMAQAFPNQTPEQWTDRLLASADNQIGFTQDGIVTFGNGVKHGYSSEAGHGIYDVYAALQPITSTSYAQSMFAGASDNEGSSFTLVSSKLSGSQSFGDALTNALKDESTYFYDALDGGFEFSLDQMVKDSKFVTSNGVKLAQNIIGPVRDEWKIKDQTNGHEIHAAKSNYFDSSVNTQSKALNEFFDSGKAYAFGTDNYFLPFMTTIQGGSGANLGLKLRDDKGFLTLSSVRTPSSKSALANQNAFVATYEDSLQNFGSYGLMLGNVNEGSSFLGTSGAGAFNLDNSKSKTSIMNAKLTLNVSANSTLGLMSGISKSYLSRGTDGVITGIDDVVSDSFALSYNVLGQSKVEKFSFSLSQPHRIRSGSMDVRIAGLKDKNGNIPYEYKSLGLNPTGRQLDLSFGYTRDLSKKTTVSTQFTITKDAGHKKSYQQNGSIYVGLIKEKIFGQDKINLGAVVSDTSGQTNAKVNYSINW